MADIKQAAKWMSEGKTVFRSSRSERYWLVPWEPLRISYDVVCADGGEHVLDFGDLQADDWEISNS